MIDKLDDILDKFVIIIMVFTFGLMILDPLIDSYTPREIYEYEYVDLDNNTGKAEYCSYKFVGYKKGGQGSPICELSDGTIKQVKQYKKVLVGTCTPAKDKEC